ncbi:MAG: YggS family pyridoxal phosphate-dependent enzyme, partial [Actinobacteria bacterium]|nr:YggS family pyridoxal phosphate-dependent enzyme [Actinomycetota bacterium]
MNRRDDIAAALAAVKSKIPSEKTLIVVTKTFPLSDIEILYQLGERN